MLALTLGFLLVATARGQFTCPRNANNECMDGNHPNPYDCGSFYQCANCVAYRQSCPPGLHYSPRRNACVFPREAKCVVSPPPTLSPSPVTQSNMTTEEAEYYTTQAPSFDFNRTAFFVGRNTSTSVSGRVEFTLSVIDAGSDYDRGSRTLTARRDGVYFHSISAGALQGQAVNMKLEVSGRNYTISRSSTAHGDHDTTSRDLLSSLSAGQSVWVTNSASLYSDLLLATSWTAIGLNDTMLKEQAFSVGRTSGYEGPTDRLFFDRVIANVGGGFDTSRSHYVAQFDGIYFFSISMGARAGRPLRASLVVGNTELVRLTRESTSHNGTDILSRSVLVTLAHGQEVRVGLWGDNTAIYSDGEVPTSFTGFLYDPILASTSFAWSVGRKESLTSIPDYIPAIDFDNVIVNEGNAWDPNERAVIANHSGYYYVHVSAGALSRVPVHVILTVNEVPDVDLWRPGNYHNGNDTLSRSALVQLDAGDRLQVAAATSTGLYSDEGLQTSFSGFFVTPDNITLSTE